LRGGQTGTTRIRQPAAAAPGWPAIPAAVPTPRLPLSLTVGPYMLEHPTLLLLPWAPDQDGQRAGPGRAGKRFVQDPETGRTLGFAARLPSWLPSGLRWLARPALEVRETHPGDDGSSDASLLCTLYGPSFLVRSWAVFDAEDHLVGTLRGVFVLDRYGMKLARVEGTPEGGRYRFRTAGGSELGCLDAAGVGHRLTFGPAGAGNPFVKMLLLAAALALTHGPTAGAR
jgi:hypothetical protein